MRLFSYGFTESCIYRTDNIILIENYCYPKRNYPARSFDIISLKIGHLYFYQEFEDYTERSIILRAFKKDLALDFPKSFKNLNKEDINRLLEKSSKRYLPGCWAIIRNQTEEQKSVSCYKLDPEDHKTWLDDSTQKIANPDVWNNTYNQFIEVIR